MTLDKSKNISILFVDDEADFRKALAFSFERKGYRVLTAANGNEAFDIISKGSIDVVVSDIRMPGGDGIELLDKTRERHIGTPIILLVTGFADVSTEDAHNKGAEALFSKPFDLNTLEDAIERLLTPPDKRWASSTMTPVDNEIKVELQYHNLSTAIEAKAVSIGRGGIFLALNENFPNINDQIGFKITFKGESEPLTGEGIVRWIRTQDSTLYSSGFGLEFTFIGDKERKKIIDYVNSKRMKMFIPKN